MTSRQSARPQLDPQLSPRPLGAENSGPAAPAPISAPIPQDELARRSQLSAGSGERAPGAETAPAAELTDAASSPPALADDRALTDLSAPAPLGTAPAFQAKPRRQPAPLEDGASEPELDLGTVTGEDPLAEPEPPKVATARSRYEAARLTTRRLRREEADEAQIALAASHQAATHRALKAAIAEAEAANAPPPAAVDPVAAPEPEEDSVEAQLSRPPLAAAYEMLGMQAATVPTAKDAFVAMNTVVSAAKKSSKAETLALARAAREIALERIKAEKAEKQQVQADAATAQSADADAKPAAAPAPRIETAPSPVIGQLFRPTVKAARFMPRHLAIALTFALVVLLPAVIMAAYLWTRAADQYASYLGFSVHQENNAGAASLLTGLSAISGSTSPDTDILYQYLQSQDLVATINREVNLIEIWSKPQRDPVFTYHGRTVEDLTDYWSRMVTVYYNQNARLIEVRVKAFDPQDSKRVAEAVLAESTLMINRLNEVAAADAVRYADEELAKTREDLVLARQALTAFRNTHQFISPEAEATAQSGIIAGLETQLVTAYIELDTLRQNDNSTDPRIGVVERRIKVIEDRVATERQKVGAGQGNGEKAFVSLVSDYERLAADVLFAENAYNAARSALDAAQIEARRQNRYLAAHIRPTLAESARFPERFLLLGVATVFLLMAWAVGALFYYSLRDRH